MAKSTTHSTITAVELGAAAVRVLEIQWGGGNADGQILRRGSANLPASYWQDPAGQSAVLATAIKEALLSASISTKAVVVSIPRWLVTVRFARLPHAEPAQLRDMVHLEAQQYVLFPIEEVVLDYCLVEDMVGGADDLQTVLLAAVRRPVLQSVLGACERSGLEVTQVTVSSLALAEHLRGTMETTALVHVETGTIDVVVLSNRQLLFSRASQLDTVHTADFTHQRLKEEIARTFLAYQNEFANRPITEVLLSGEGTRSGTPLEQLMQEVIDLPVHRLRAKLLPPNEISNYTVAAGTALQSHPSVIERVNLMPTEGAERKAEATRKRNNLLALAVAGVAIVGAVGFVNSQLKAQEKSQKELKLLTNELDDVKSQADTRKRAYDNVKSVFDDLEMGLGRKHPIVDVLVVISKALPTGAEAWLTQLSFERGGTLTIRGESKSETVATDMVIALQKTGAFSEVHLGYLGDAQSNTNTQTTPAKPAANGAANIPALPGMQNKPGGAQPGIPPPAPSMMTPATPIKSTPTPNPMPTPPPPMPMPQPFPGGRPAGLGGLPAGFPPPGAIQIQGGTGAVISDVSAPIIVETKGGPNPGQLPSPSPAPEQTKAVRSERPVQVKPGTVTIQGSPVIIQGGQVPISGKIQVAPVPANNHRPTPAIALSPIVKDMKIPAKVAPTAPATKAAKPTDAATASKTPEVEAKPTNKMSFVITCKLNPAVQDIVAKVKTDAPKKEEKKSEH